jgi:tRNA pseudouridine32 synthase/23S rRNA pseudouridine746 synthase/23S rRNA pseudouridine1911/1915/1917 synthase
MGTNKKPNRRHLPKGLVIIHEDEALIVVDKPAGMLTMGTDTDTSAGVAPDQINLFLSFID